MPSRLLRVLTRRVALGALLAAAASPVAAGTISPDFEFHVTLEAEGQSSLTYTYGPANGTPTGDGLTINDGYLGSYADASWEIFVDPDPVLSGTLSLTNLLSTPTTFTLTAVLPTGFFGPTTVQGGFIGDVIITDTNGDSSVSLSSLPGAGIYDAQVDGSSVQQLLSGTFNASGGPGVFTIISQQAFGTPIPSQPGGPVNSDIRVVNRFTLSGGDTIELPFLFQVEAGVPEPTTGLLMLAGLLGLAARTRRAH